MAKVVVNMGWRAFVMDSNRALTLLDLMKDVELYEEKYSSKSVHVYPNDKKDISITLLPDAMYRMAKLAGKPEEK
jgi:hypothetical protein